MNSRHEFFLLLDSYNCEQKESTKKGGSIHYTGKLCNLALFQHCRVRVIFEKNSRRTAESENISQRSMTGGGGVGSCLLAELYRLPGPK